MMEGMSQEGVSMGNFDHTAPMDWQEYLDEFLNAHDPSVGIYRIARLKPSDEEWLESCLVDDDLELEDFGAERIVFRSPLDGMRVTAVFEATDAGGSWQVASVRRIREGR